VIAGMHAIMALLQLLPSNNTGHKAKAGAAKVQNILISFQPQQTTDLAVTYF